MANHVGVPKQLVTQRLELQYEGYPSLVDYGRGIGIEGQKDFRWLGRGIAAWFPFDLISLVSCMKITPYKRNTNLTFYFTTV